MKGRWTFGWLGLLRGVALLVLGIFILRNPQVALSGLVLCFAAAAILSGAADIALYVKLRGGAMPEVTVSLAAGIISFLAGVLLLLSPWNSSWILRTVIPVWFVAQCISHRMHYGLIRQAGGRMVSPILLCLNVTGLLLGIVMVFNSALFTLSIGVLTALVLIVLGTSSTVEALGSMKWITGQVRPFSDRKERTT